MKQSFDLFLKKSHIVSDYDTYPFSFNILKRYKLNNINSISICNKYIAVSHGSKVNFYNLSDNSENIYNGSDIITKIKFRHDGEILAIGYENGLIEFIGLFCYDRIKSFKNHKTSINDIIFYKNYDLYFSCCRNFIINIWHVIEGKCLYTLKYHIDVITSLNLYTCENYDILISTGYDGKVYFYDLNSNKLLDKKIDIKEAIECCHIFKEKYLFIAVKNIVKMYCIQTLQLIKDIIFSDKTIYSLNTFKEYVVALCINNRIFLFDPFNKSSHLNVNIVCIYAYNCIYKYIDINNESIAMANVGHFIMSTFTPNKSIRQNNLNKNGRIYVGMELFGSSKLDYFLKNFKYKEALLFTLQSAPLSTLSLINLYSKHKVIAASLRLLNESEIINILYYIRRRFICNTLMFEFILTLFSVTNFCEYNSQKLLKQLKELKNKFFHIKKHIKTYATLKKITEKLIKKTK